MAEPPLLTLAGRVVGTRSHARSFIAEHADRVNPNVAVYLDARAVSVISSPWVNEVLDAWPHATPVGACEDVQHTWNLVLATRSARQRRSS